MSLRKLQLKKELLNQGWDLPHIQFVLTLPPENEVEVEDAVYQYLDEY